MGWIFNSRKDKPKGKYNGKTTSATNTVTTASTKTSQIGFNTVTHSVPRPEDTKDMSKLSVVLFKQTWLNGMSAICQPPAGGSEFQIHYRALVVRIKNSTNEFILSIPTYFYNFDQKVTSGSVAYHLDNVDKEADAGKAISDVKIQELWVQFPVISVLQQALPNATVSYEEVNSGSLHRHPGRFGFSTIDYDKNPTNPGVIYREAQAMDKVHTDSVIYLGTNTEIYTTETRILNLEPHNGGVKGTYCQIPTLTYVLDDLKTTDSTKVQDDVDKMAELLMGMIDSASKAPDDNAKSYTTVTSMGAKKGYVLVNELLGEFKTSSYTPDMKNVLANRVTPLYASYNKSSAVVYGSTGAKKGAGYLSAWYDDDGEDYWMGRYTPVKETKPKQVSTTTKNPYAVGSKAWAEWNLQKNQ
jgi:hypothetical protein